MNTILKEFAKEPKCEKCLSGINITSYHPDPTTHAPVAICRGITGEHLFRKCANCGYLWVEKCASIVAPYRFIIYENDVKYRSNLSNLFIFLWEEIKGFLKRF